MDEVEGLFALRAATYFWEMSFLRATLFLLLGATAWGCGSDSDSTPAATVDSAVGDTAKTDTSSKPDTATDIAVDSTTDASEDAEEAGDDGSVGCLVGESCNTERPCADPYICYGFGETGFCAPPEPQCGGFVMKPCTGGRVCLRASGSSLGYCADATEMACICGKPDAGKVDGC